ncbi:gfo/Idh/MocA family oxidoreductase [Halobacteriales archaeon QH_8_64_26]|nr:MAG: gfo/Idh/MocA family oxidoreductase [Halobacteriales archaeon QH_8_64_26]
MMENGRPKAGVIGVGTMGQHHARVYAELAEVDLLGVCDADADRAASVAEHNATRSLSRDGLLDAVDLVSIAVPTEYHYELARECIERGVHVLVEKPFVAEREEGERLASLAEERDVRIQVGHIERFNPAVAAVREVLDDHDLIAVDAKRLSPPLDRNIEDSAAFDLMIHDIDVLFSLAGSELTALNASGTRENRYIDAQLGFESGVVASLTASRLTQEKVRKLSITTAESWIVVDYLDQSIEMHRHSLPEYIEQQGELRYRHEGIVERPMVESAEPLKRELASFVECVRSGREPEVSVADGLCALDVAKRIDELAAESGANAPELPSDSP